MEQFKVGDKVTVTSNRHDGPNGVYRSYFDEIPCEGLVTFVGEDSVGVAVVEESGELDQEVSPKNLTLIKEKNVNVPFTATKTSISVCLDGKMHNITSTDASFELLKEELQKPTHDLQAIRDILDKPALISRVSEGQVVVEDGQVMYQGQAVHSTLTRKLLGMMGEGYDIKPWAKFLDNLMKNPSYRSREALYDFLDNFSTPITEDGCFIAFKRVRDTYYDIHSNSMLNKPGMTVEMDRTQVDDDNDRTCSAGLHACASNYLGSFYARSPGYRVVALKINPADVVSVPRDYQFSKMRVCKYYVIGDAEEADIDMLSKSEATTWDQDYGKSSWESFVPEEDSFEDYCDDSYVESYE